MKLTSSGVFLFPGYVYLHRLCIWEDGIPIQGLHDLWIVTSWERGLGYGGLMWGAAVERGSSGELSQKQGEKNT